MAGQAALSGNASLIDTFIVSKYVYSICCITCFTTIIHLPHHCKVLNSLMCADAPLSNYSLTQSRDIKEPT